MGSNSDVSAFTRFLRAVLMLINFILILIALAGIIICAIQLADKDRNVLKLCVQCQGINVFLIVAFSVLLVCSMVGFCALWRRDTCMLVLYVIFLVLFFLASLTCVVVFIMVKRGEFDTQLFNSWKRQVRDDPNAICSFETASNCNGWDFLCPTTGAGSETCVTTCTTEQFAQIRTYTETCHDKINSDVNRYYGPLLGIGFGMVFTALIAIVVSIKLIHTYHYSKTVVTTSS